VAAPHVLVTGASGFVGRYAVEALVEHGCTVAATSGSPRPDWLHGEVAWSTVDLLDSASLAQLPRTYDAVLHLAGDTVPNRMEGLAATLRNAEMVARLLDHLTPTRFMLVSSCHVYAPGVSPKVETSRISPPGLYGLSKHLAEQLALLNGRGFEPIIMRPFNHVGIGMRPELMVPQLLASIRASSNTTAPLVMRGKDSVRDFLDVRDIVAAYAAVLCLKPLPHSVFNVCSGVAVRISQLAELALALAGTPRPIAFGAANSSDDTDVLVGDPSRLKIAVGWQPRYTLHDSIEACLAAG
jgi:GDP-4-dehydro-6-deoxy-D-mannose reductase